MVYYIVSGLFLMFFWCPCMAINVVSSVQYNGGLLPDIMLLTQCYFHRGTLYDPPLLRLLNFQVNTVVGLFCIMLKISTWLVGRRLCPS